MYDCSRKMFLMIYSINWLKFIIWLSLLLEILGNMCIAIVFSRLWCHNFEINLICLIKPFFYKTKKLRQKCKLKLKNENSFQGEIKSISHHIYRWNQKHLSSYLKVKSKASLIIFKGLSVARNCLRLESATLIGFWWLKTKLLKKNRNLICKREECTFQ